MVDKSKSTVGNCIFSFVAFSSFEHYFIGVTDLKLWFPELEIGEMKRLGILIASLSY